LYKHIRLFAQKVLRMPGRLGRVSRFLMSVNVSSNLCHSPWASGDTAFSPAARSGVAIRAAIEAMMSCVASMMTRK
jgi:hypothetical protein